MEVRGEAEAGKFLTCGALSLGIWFILSLVLVNTHTFVNRGAALLVDGLTRAFVRRNCPALNRFEFGARCSRG